MRTATFTGTPLLADYSRVRETFHAALEIGSETDRKQYLDEACGSDAELHKLVDELLRADGEAEGFLDVDATAPTQPNPIREGAAVGQYKLREKLGSGGFGVVYVAEQTTPVRRKVALKVIKPGMDSGEVLARFEAERQALALMDHPHIAKVYDAGTTETGYPYFVMELVKGVPITEYCDEQTSDVNERLNLCRDVCGAIQHAHQKGVVHRDLKPSNILVAVSDGRPVVKVIDFGVAKALSQPLTDQTIYTRFTQMIGTPLYMSPEQAESSEDIDTRADVYSIGVLLYELLTGTTPFRKQQLLRAGLDEMRRILKEEEPDKPSSRISTLGEQLTSVAAVRRQEPKRLSSLLKGDLDWIVMKALEKDRARRYASPGELAADIDRFLRHDPVEARPQSAAYRMRKLAARHRVLLSTASAFVGLLVAGVILTSWLAIRATNAEQQATERAGEAIAAETKAQAAKERATSLASDNLALAKAEKKTRLETERRLRVANAYRLAALSSLARPTHPEKSVLLAAEAIKATTDHNEPVLGVCHQALVDGLQATGGIDLRATENGSIHSISGDGRWALMVAQDKLTVWDLASPEPENSARHFEGKYNSQLSPRGRFLVSARGNDALIWDLESDSELPHAVLKGHTGPLSRMLFSPNGSQLITAAKDRTIRLWNMDDLAKPSRVVARQTPGHCRSLSVSADGKRLLASHGVSGWPNHDDTLPTTLTLWQLDEPEFLARPIDTSRAAPNLYDAKLSADGRWVIARLWGMKLYLWDLKTDPEAKRPSELPYDREYAVSPQGNWLAASSRAGSIRLWDLSAPNLRDSEIELFGHEEGILELVIDPPGKQLASCSRDGTARIWDLDTVQLAHRSRVLRGHDGYVGGAAFGPRGRRLITSGGGGTQRLWDLQREPLAYPITINRVRGKYPFDQPPATSADGTRLAVLLPRRDALDIYDLSDGETTPFARLTWSRHLIERVAMSRDGRRVLTIDENGLMQLWQIDDSDGSVLRRGSEMQQEGRGDAAFLLDDELITLQWPGRVSRLSKQEDVQNLHGLVRIWDLRGSDSAPRQIELPLPPNYWNSDITLLTPDGQLAHYEAYDP